MRQRAVIGAVVLLLAVGALVAGTQFVRDGRRRAREAQSRGALSQIGLALQNYAAEYGTFPPLAIVDEKGRALLSWRVLLLPYLGEGETLAELDLSEPWDSPKNLETAKHASPRVIRWFRTPSDFGLDPNTTSFVALGFSTGKLPHGRGHDRRIMVVELHDTQINWMEPRELSATEVRSRVVKMVERGEWVHVLMADGTAATITQNSPIFHGSADEPLDQWSVQE